MSHDRIVEAAADALFDQHEQRLQFRPIAPVPPHFDEAFVYAVQVGLLARRQTKARDEIAGYKIGLTTPRMQTLCHGDRPISGVMFERGIRHAEPGRAATVALTDFVHLGIESELAVRLARPLDGSKREITRAEVATAVGEVAAAFELIEDRHADYSTLDWRSMAADNSWHAGLVLAPSIAVNALRDIGDLAGVLAIDGVEVDRGSTSDVLGHPFDAVAWLAKHLAARNKVIEAGHWISTGSIATIRFAEPGCRYRFTIAGLPTVELEID